MTLIKEMICWIHRIIGLDLFLNARLSARNRLFLLERPTIQSSFFLPIIERNVRLMISSFLMRKIRIVSLSFQKTMNHVFNLWQIRQKAPLEYTLRSLKFLVFFKNFPHSHALTLISQSKRFNIPIQILLGTTQMILSCLILCSSVGTTGRITRVLWKRKTSRWIRLAFEVLMRVSFPKGKEREIEIYSFRWFKNRQVSWEIWPWLVSNSGPFC